MMTWIIGGIFAFAIGSAIVNQNTAPSAPAAPPKPVDPNAELRFQKSVRVAQAVKASLRNPDSVKWGGILANDDGSVVCIEYRAQNGFGGMSVEQIAFVKEKFQTSASVWNKSCANKPLHDMRHVKNIL